IVKAIDIKPTPVLWHEDNIGRRQQVRERPQVSGAIAGSQLGEAAHRLVRNSLNIKLNNISQQHASHHTINNLQSAGSSGHGKHYPESTDGYNGQYNHQGIMTRPKYPISSNEGGRQNFRALDRLQQKPFHNLKTGFSAMTIEEEARTRTSGPTANPQHQHMGLRKWSPKTSIMNGKYTGPAASGKQMKVVYQVKMRQHHDKPEDGNQ
ncbi:5'-3' exoribonuclease 4, partial [Stylosanthes scabra]|nr:5'-3' exoribonuclease 4 [Stylosanthes scabra]